MPVKSAKRQRRGANSTDLAQRLAGLTLSKEQLRKLVKKYPAPQRWYDEADGDRPSKK